MTPKPNIDTAIDTALEEDICGHIFTVSATMVGVCLTVIGLVRIVISMGKAESIADDLLALNATLFLVSCVSAYIALRTRNASRMHRVERFADAVFLIAMLLMVVICVVIAFAITTL